MTPVNNTNLKSANLIIAGVNKAGTTSLFHYLSAHPDICGSKDKETCYFLPVLYDKPLSPITDYYSQFTHCKNAAYRLEATPGYITGGAKMADTISATLGGVKIIFILKEPVERLISFYKRKKATLQLPRDMSFVAFVSRCRDANELSVHVQENHLYNALQVGKYANYLEPWLTNSQLQSKILFFDDLKKDPKKLMQQLCSWLNINASVYDDYNFDVRNKSMNYRNAMLQQLAVKANLAGQRLWRFNPNLKKNLSSLYYKFNGASFHRDNIDMETVKYLKSYYRESNQQLGLLLSRHGINANLPAWLETETVPA